MELLDDIVDLGGQVACIHGHCDSSPQVRALTAVRGNKSKTSIISDNEICCQSCTIAAAMRLRGKATAQIAS
jgi:hypothetical protein